MAVRPTEVRATTSLNASCESSPQSVNQAPWDVGSKGQAPTPDGQIAALMH